MLAPADLFVVSDTLDALLLGSFFFGLVFVVLSLTLGAADIGFGHGHGGLDGGGHGHDAGQHSGWLAQINIGTVLAFLMWFGGITYLLRNAAGFNSAISLLIGIGGGVACAAIVLRFMRMLKSSEVYLDARQEQLVGTIGRISSPVRADGTGEITYVLNGVRQVSAARSVSGIALPRGTEVVVLRRERGIALVEPWIEVSESDAWERKFAADAGQRHEALPHPEH
jgi:membrane protein implicated in regulation of membrane protease activity